MKAKKLTEAGIQRFKPESTRVELSDAIVPGLRLVVQPSGKKSWAVRTRLRGKLIKYTVGPYPAFGLADARDMARDVLQAVQRGEDPRALRRTAEADSIEAVVADWLKRDQSKNRGHDRLKRMFEREVFPRWRDRPITEITRRDCRDLIDRIADRGTVGSARRAHAHLHRMFRWAVGRDIIEANPMADLPKPGKENPRDRVLTDAELVEVWRATEVLKTRGSHTFPAAPGWPFGPVIRLLILTAARLDEIGSLAWAEVDRDANVIRLAGSRTKNSDPRTIPLSPLAARIIDGLPEIGADKGQVRYVFTTNNRTAVSGWSNAKKQVDDVIVEARRDAARESGGDPAKVRPIEPGWRIHDLRRTAATGLQRLGFKLEVIEAVLGHVSGSRAGIVGVYQRHSFEDEKRAALDAWADHVQKLVEGRTAKVVPLRAAVG